ncbi:MAG: hypothetical protein NZT92_03295 [Abditibacteriales bacterium]|nr:hypothetical protein [Abditibacteriales bacterium]MDW8364913.1 hypothetical protein [Abditibacteriales bacterium]
MNSNQPRQEQWLVWVVAAAIVLYSLAVGCGLMIQAAAGGGTEWAFPLMSVPCFITAGWYVYVYLSAHASGRDAGLVLSAIGWAAVGMAFLFKREGTPTDGGWSAQSVGWSALAIVGIVGGALVSIRSRRRSARIPRAPSRPSQTSSPPSPDKKKE